MMSARYPPAPSPLLYAHETAAGEKLVWCTFGPDQVDLDFSNPDLLCEFVRLLRLYMNKGVRVFGWMRSGFVETARLDLSSSR